MKGTSSFSSSSPLPALGGLASAVAVLGILRAMHSRSRAHRHNLSWETCSSECAALQADAVRHADKSHNNGSNNNSMNDAEEVAPWADERGMYYRVPETLAMPCLCDAHNATTADNHDEDVNCPHAFPNNTNRATPAHWPLRAQQIEGLGYFGITQGERPCRAQLTRSQLDAIGCGADAPPLFRFGAIADIQYADLPTGETRGPARRVYQHSLCALNQAVLSWNLVPGGLRFVAQ
jgi:hypothetical protein